MASRNLARSLVDYESAVECLPAGALVDSQVQVKSFALAQDGPIKVFWAPFDHVNRRAKVVLVGITPGATQMRAAFETARDSLNRGLQCDTAARYAKTHASFSGPMRSVLVGWLDGIGLARRLELTTSAELWESAAPLAHFTSTLRYPVFKDGKRYGGTPSMLSNPMLRRYVDEVFVPEMRSLAPAVVIGLGDAVKATLRHAADQGALDERRVLFDLPHPSTGRGFPARQEKYEIRRRTLQRQVARLLP